MSPVMALGFEKLSVRENNFTHARKVLIHVSVIIGRAVTFRDPHVAYVH